jgi:DNA-binding NtrC family response regulator
MSALRILLVDDEADFLQVTAKRLRLRGMEVTAAAGGEEALRLAAVRPFDVALLDLAMPGMDGLETLQQLKERIPALQVVFLLTGRATIKTGVEALRLGATDVLEKPIDIETLVGALESACRGEGEA